MRGLRGYVAVGITQPSRSAGRRGDQQATRPRMSATIVIIVLGAAIAGFVQGLSGFTFGLVATSIWIWAVEPQLIAPMVVFGAMMGQLLAAFTVRRGFNWKLLWPYLAGGFAGIPIGVAVLPHLDVHLFKTMLGSLLAIWCPIMLVSSRLPPIRVGGAALNSVIGLTGGIMSGFGGFSGVIPTLWCTLRRYDKDVQRSIIQNFNLAILTTTMAGYIASGIVTMKLLPTFGLILPAMLIPTLLGTRVYIGISETAFRQIVLGLLTLSGIAMLVSSVPHLFGRM